jgi:hypothetical protein
MIAGRTAIGPGTLLAVISRFGRILSRLVLSNGLFPILKAELKLLNCQLFGATTELMTRQALDHQPQFVVLGVQLAQHLLQHDGIIRQCVSVDRHNLVMNDVSASVLEFFVRQTGILSRQLRPAPCYRRPPLASVKQSGQLRRGQHDPPGRARRWPGELTLLKPFGQHAQPNAVVPD